MTRVIGFHACTREFAESLQSGKLTVDHWKSSTNQYDWLGDGIYFWENGYRRAVEWANEFVRGESAIVEAEIDLGSCFDLTNSQYVDLLVEVHASLVELYGAEGWQLPENVDLAGRKPLRRWLLKTLDGVNSFLYRFLVGVDFRRSERRRLRYLDSLVINQFLSLMETGFGDEVILFQTVRSPFEEGDPLFPGSMIRRQTHIQIAVRDRSCITPVRFHRL